MRGSNSASCEPVAIRPSDNDEARMSNDEGMTKFELSLELCTALFDIGSFELPSSFVIRASSFLSFVLPSPYPLPQGEEREIVIWFGHSIVFLHSAFRRVNSRVR